MWKNKSDIQGSKLNSSFNNLDSVIEFDFSYKSLQSDHLEPVAEQVVDMRGGGGLR